MMKDRKDVAIIVQSCQIWITYIKKRLDRGPKATKEVIINNAKEVYTATNKQQTRDLANADCIRTGRMRNVLVRKPLLH